MPRLAALMMPLVFASAYRIGCDCSGSAPGGPTSDAGGLDASTVAPALVLRDPTTGSPQETAQQLVNVVITGDADATQWCLSEEQATVPGATCTGGSGTPNGWASSRPATFALSPGEGQKTVYLWLAPSNGGASAVISLSHLPVPIAFHRRPVHISSARKAFTRLSGWCGEPTGLVELSAGSITGSSLCGADAGWSATLDFSSAPEGKVQVSGVQRSVSGLLASPPTLHALVKDTAFCDNPVNASAAPFAAGSGLDSDPYFICTGDQLLALDTHLDASAKLKNDLILDGGPWPGIGGGAPFTGTFNGDDYAVVNVSFDAGAWNYGMFMTVWGTVENVSLEDVYIVGFQIVGGLVGTLADGGVIRNCATTGTIVTGGPSAFHLGGLAGENWGDIFDSESSVNLPGPDGWSVGGLVGHAYGGTIQRCRASGSIVAGGTSGGGLVGRLGNFNSTCDISDSYATGPVNVLDSGIAGGLIGEHIQGNVTRCYSTGATTGAPPSGGLIGTTSAASKIVADSYWNVETSGLDASFGGLGYTSAQMSDAGSFPGWDFASVWTFDPTQSAFPVLRTIPY